MDISESTEEINHMSTEGQTGSSDPVAQLKKEFIKPVISLPVDVLEATTFFQATDSGSTT